MSNAILHGRTILVVEDEPLITWELESILAAEGASVVGVTMQEAEDCAKTREIAAAILDVQPGSDEHRRVARQLRKRGIPFLFHATHRPEDVTTIRGAPSVLKPSDPKDIILALSLLLQQRR